MSDHDPGPVPDHQVAYDAFGLPLYGFSVTEMTKEAAQLAATLALNSHDKQAVKRILAELAQSHQDQGAYLLFLSMRGLQYLAEDIFGPTLFVLERKIPDLDLRDQLRAVADPQSYVWNTEA